MPILTKEHALKIAKKLKADIDERKNRPHDLARIYYGEKLVTSFGIRRGSKKNLGHDHIPSQIYASPRNTRLLADCPLSREDWVKSLKEKGWIS